MTKAGNMLFSDLINCPGKRRGNALFMVLIAVALFAALGYAVTRSGQGSSSASREQLSLGVARLISFTGQMRAAVTQYKLIHGVTVTGVYFNNDTYRNKDNTLKFTAMGTPADPSLYIFHPQGGGVAPLTFTDLGTVCSGCAATTTREGHMRSLTWINIPGLGTSAAEAVFLISDMSVTACNEVQKIGDISSIPVYDITTFPDATFGSAPATGLGAVTNGLAGKTEFCVRHSGSPARYFYFGVLEVN